jgi:hypothetical protein
VDTIRQRLGCRQECNLCSGSTAALRLILVPVNAHHTAPISDTPAKKTQKNQLRSMTTHVHADIHARTCNAEATEHSQLTHLPNHCSCHLSHTHPDFTLWTLALAPGPTSGHCCSFLLAATCTIETRPPDNSSSNGDTGGTATLVCVKVKATCPSQNMAGTLVSVTELASQCHPDACQLGNSQLSKGFANVRPGGVPAQLSHSSRIVHRTTDVTSELP